MNCKGQAIASIIVGLTIMLIIGIVVTAVVNKQVQSHTELDNYINESRTAAADVFYLKNPPVVSVTHVNNGTVEFANFTWRRDGFVNVTQTKAAATDTYKVSYAGEPSGYISGTAATVTKLIPLLLALMLFIAVAGYITLK